MPSPGSRVQLERGLRLAGFALLAFCAWAITAAPTAPSRLVVRSPGRTGPGALGSLLRGWTRRAPAETLALEVASVPAAVERDWLAALAGAGTAVTWSGALLPTAMEVLPVSDPAGGISVLAAAPVGTRVQLADSLGILDSATVTRAGAAFRVAAHTGPLQIAAGAQVARAATWDSLAPRHAVVLGAAEWETRFVIAALEERGWIVDARLAVAPGIAVTQGRPFPFDTARQAVVVALDALAPGEAQAVARFASGGGGVVVGAAAARGLGRVAAGGVGAHLRAPEITFTAVAPRRALALDPILPRGDAVVLERQGPHVVLAARRAGAGRVVQTGYDETWRWRLAGPGDATDAHREWWAGVVAAAAYRSEMAVGPSRAAGDDRAPLAALVDALGPAQPGASRAAGGFDPRSLLPLAGSLLLLCLIAEWASRRLRGAA